MPSPFDLTQGSASGFPAGQQRTYVLSNTLDLSVTNMAATEVARMIHIPAGSFVHHVRWEVTTVEGATLTFDVGDDSDTDGYVVSANANALGSGMSTFAGTLGGTGAAADPVVITGYSAGKYYAAADTIDIVTDHSAANVAVIKLSALVTDMNCY